MNKVFLKLIEIFTGKVYRAGEWYQRDRNGWRRVRPKGIHP